jgi:hypothetical protein
MKNWKRGVALCYALSFSKMEDKLKLVVVAK